MDDPVFTERELDIMSVLWHEGSGSVAEVREALGDSVGYTTILKLLQILEEKGAVRHEQEGRAYRYYPLVEQARAGGTALNRILDKIFGGSAELLLSQLVSDQNIGPEELARMRRLLNETEEEEIEGPKPQEDGPKPQEDGPEPREDRLREDRRDA